MAPKDPNDSDDEINDDLLQWSLNEAVSTMLTPRSSMVDVGAGRRLSRASVRFFQKETSTRHLSVASGLSLPSRPSWSEVPLHCRCLLPHQRLPH